MRRLVARWLIAAIPLVLGVSVPTFVLASLVPGDAARTILGVNANPQQYAALRDQLRLNDPLWTQYGHWLSRALHGDLGLSIQSADSVGHELAGRLAVTLSLVAGATLVAIGRFVDKKAPQLTVLAFAQVLRECPEAELIMIGEGPLLEACKQLAYGLNVQSKIHFPGKQDRSQAAKVLKLSRAFVQHSLTTTYGDSEGTAITILEAGAAGLPVVSTRHAGIKESVSHGETGFLVEERDVSKMAFYMTELAKNPGKARAMGLKAREHVGRNFSTDLVMGNLHAILQNAANGLGGKRKETTGPSHRMKVQED